MNFPVPSYTRCDYTNDVESGRFLKNPTLVPYLKLPPWVRISKTYDPGRKSVGAVFMADGPKKKGEGLHAGLIETGIVDWYVTDIPDIYRGQVCRNVALFHFSADRRTMAVYLFTGMQRPNIEERVKFARQHIPALIANESAKAAA